MTSNATHAFFVQPTDGEVIGVEPTGALIQWDAEAGAPYTSGETLEQFGLENLSAAEVVLVKMVQAGWVMDAKDRTAFTKEYQTAVGPKTAIANLRQGTDSYRIEGLYYSEGRNVLSTSTVYFPKTCLVANVAKHVEAFVADCESRIDQSYARRLVQTA